MWGVRALETLLLGMVITIWPKRLAEEKKARDGVFPSVSDSLGVFSVPRKF
jgi:hypothetical protein